MASTPEGKVKSDIQKALQGFGIANAKDVANIVARGEPFFGWYFMPVQGMMSVAGIPDFIGMYRGRGFVIEAKRNKNEAPTAKQLDQLNAVTRVGGAAFVIFDIAGFGLFTDWITEVDKELEWLQAHPPS